MKTAGAQTVSFDVAMTGSPVPVPTVITLVMSGTAAQGIDYVWGGAAEIVIPAGETTAGTQITFQVEDDEVHEPDNETIVVTARWDHQDLGQVTLTIIDNYSGAGDSQPDSGGEPDCGRRLSHRPLRHLFGQGPDLSRPQASGDAISVELDGLLARDHRQLPGFGPRDGRRDQCRRFGQLQFRRVRHGVVYPERRSGYDA